MSKIYSNISTICAARLPMASTHRRQNSSRWRRELGSCWPKCIFSIANLIDLKELDVEKTNGDIGSAVTAMVKREFSALADAAHQGMEPSKKDARSSLSRYPGSVVNTS